MPAERCVHLAKRLGFESLGRSSLSKSEPIFRSYISLVVEFEKPFMGPHFAIALCRWSRQTTQTGPCLPPLLCTVSMVNEMCYIDYRMWFEPPRHRGTFLPLRASAHDFSTCTAWLSRECRSPNHLLESLPIPVGTRAGTWNVEVSSSVPVALVIKSKTKRARITQL